MSDTNIATIQILIIIEILKIKVNNFTFKNY